MEDKSAGVMNGSIDSPDPDNTLGFRVALSDIQRSVSRASNQANTSTEDQTYRYALLLSLQGLNERLEHLCKTFHHAVNEDNVEEGV